MASIAAIGNSAAREAYGNPGRTDNLAEAHDAEADRAVAQVGITRFRCTVEVDVDHVVEHAHGGAARCAASLAWSSLRRRRGGAAG